MHKLMEKKSYSELMQQSVEEARFYMEPANAVIDKNMVQLMRRTNPKFWNVSCKLPPSPIWNAFR